MKQNRVRSLALRERLPVVSRRWEKYFYVNIPMKVKSFLGEKNCRNSPHLKERESLVIWGMIRSCLMTVLKRMF